MRRSSMDMGKRATRFFVGAWAAAMSVGCFTNITGVDRDREVEVSEAYFLEVDAATDLRLRLEGINGIVTVLGDAGATTARVSAVRRVKSDTRADAEQFLDRVTVEVVEQGDEILVRTDQPRETGGREVIVDYDVIVPSWFDVHVVNINGETELRSIDGNAEVSNTNGEVTVLDVVGDVEVVLANGDITCDVTLLPGGLVDLAVANGTIRLDVPTSTSAMIEADVANGSVSVGGLTLLDATTSARSVRGRLGTGDGLIDLGVANGTITVRGR